MLAAFKGRNIMAIDHQIQSLADLDRAVAKLRKAVSTQQITTLVAFTTDGFSVSFRKADGFELGRGVHADLTTAVNKAMTAANAQVKP